MISSHTLTIYQSAINSKVEWVWRHKLTKNSPAFSRSCDCLPFFFSDITSVTSYCCINTYGEKSIQYFHTGNIVAKQQSAYIWWHTNQSTLKRGVTNGTDPLKWNLLDFPCISTTFPSDRWDISSMLACPRDACLALAEIHANTHPRARRFRRELWRGSWSVTWSRRGIPVGLIKGMEQTAELIRDATRFLSLLSHSDFLFCSSLFP